MSENCAEDVSSPLLSCRPFLKWAGGKSQLLPQLLPRLPSEYNRYLEPFVGAGALFFALRPERAYISDSNAELMNCFEVVKSQPEELLKELQGYTYEKGFYYGIRKLDRTPEFAELSSVKRAARLIYLNKTCFNGLYRVNSKGHFNVPFGRYNNPKIVDAENLLACSDLLMRTITAAASFDKVLDIAEAGDFVYFDPPYAPVSETSDFTAYVRDGFDDAAQELLLLVCLQLNQRGVKWMVSNSNAPLIQELYRGFRIEPVYASRSINSKATKRGSVVELVIRNYGS